MYIADIPQGEKAQVERMRQTQAQILGQRISSRMEFCCLCLRELYFPKTLHIHHHKRQEAGATYTEGCGQSCGKCNQSSK